MAKQFVEKQNENIPGLVMPSKWLWIKNPWKAYKIRRKMKAALGLLGMWEEKDTSFFDERK